MVKTAGDGSVGAQARPGTRYVVGVVDVIWRDLCPSPVALDPGRDLANWPNLNWVDRATNEPEQVTIDPVDLAAILVDTPA